MAKTILIIEDNEMDMHLFSDLLQLHGYETIKLKNGKDALKIVKSHLPDLIIMGIQISGRSGVEITKELKAEERLKHIPIFVVSAWAMKEDENEIREAGCDDYMSKPIVISSFLNIVTKLLSGSDSKSSKQGPAKPNQPRLMW